MSSGSAGDRAAAQDAGRVLRTHRVGFDVDTPDGRVFAVTRSRSRDPLAAPATGDRVRLAHDPDIEHPVIVEVLPRASALIRRDPAERAQPQVLAANADVVAVVQGLDRPVNPRRVERQLALAHGSGAQVLVVATKADLDPYGAALDALRAAAPDQPLLVTSAHHDQGIADLDDATHPDRTLVLLGESGAGKSSLVNGILGHEAMAIGEVREGDRKGRHTTTRRTLIPLPGGGAVLDTPGVRAVGLWPGWADLDAVFVEVADAAEGCRFADCAHLAEPGCEVAAACDDGRIEPQRLEAWRTLREELAQTEREVERRDWR